jgi:hypothetical protein
MHPEQIYPKSANRYTLFLLAETRSLAPAEIERGVDEITCCVTVGTEDDDISTRVGSGLAPDR